jgi:hypothetical protein
MIQIFFKKVLNRIFKKSVARASARQQLEDSLRRALAQDARDSQDRYEAQARANREYEMAREHAYSQVIRDPNSDRMYVQNGAGAQQVSLAQAQAAYHYQGYQQEPQVNQHQGTYDNRIYFTGGLNPQWAQQTYDANPTLTPQMFAALQDSMVYGSGYMSLNLEGLVQKKPIKAHRKLPDWF